MTRFTQPPRRELPPEVRDRLRRKLWSELDVPARSRFSLTRAPIAAAVISAVAILVAGTVVLAQNVSSPSPKPMSAAFGNVKAASQSANADLDRCYATATLAHELPDRPQWIVVTSSEANGVTVTAARVEGKPLFCETTATTVTVSDPDGVPGYADSSGTAAMFATSNGVVAGVVDSGWSEFQLEVSPEPDKSETVTPQLSGGLFIARTQTAIDPEDPNVRLSALHDTAVHIFGSVPPVLVYANTPSN